MELLIKTAGVLLLLLALLHLIFPFYFKWKIELRSLSLINKQLMEVHTFFIALIVLLMGLLCLLNAKDILTTPLGKNIAFGMGIFWGIRLLFQFLVYSPRLWKGKYFETIIHIAFSILWACFTILFFYTSSIK